jgi:saccharopine dehydrogenase (NAD+, L-lysine-forming)
MEIKRSYHFEGVGERDMYLLYHEELESLAKHIPSVRRIRFFMTSIEPIMFEGREIIPLQFLKAVLPDPASLGPRTVGKTNIGCIFIGKKDGKDKTWRVYNIADHQEAYAEVGSQAVSYTTGVPAMIGASLVLRGLWKKPGVWNVEQLDPDPFMEDLNRFGLPWIVDENPVLVP